MALNSYHLKKGGKNMDDDEKRWNRIMAVIYFLIMMGILTFMIWKNQNTEKEKTLTPTPTVEITVEPVE